MDNNSPVIVKNVSTAIVDENSNELRKLSMN